MSRRQEFEIMFGSDSFLDIVANIVGILIILIVIAGIRVGNAPVRVEVPATELPAIPAPPEEDPYAAVPILAEVTPESEPELVLEPLPELAVPAELVAQAEDLESQIVTTTSESERLADSLAKALRLQSDLDQRLMTARELLEERKTELKVVTARDSQLKQDLDLTRQAVARLQAEVTAAEKKTPVAEKLEHRITPVGRAVMGRELHFRVEHNRVAEVPIEALVERLKDHIERRKDWILKTRQHKGQVGPINGFNLEYLLGVETMSSIEEVRAGVGGYRMSLRYWEIQPETSLRGEGEDVVLTQGSKFYQALVSSGPDTTLTFWVYPDSYSLYRKLQSFSHDHGFLVAGRPLPTGIAISGSPSGTRSSGQ